MARGPSLADRVEALLARHWWIERPSLLSRLLLPLAALYGVLATARQRTTVPRRAPVPVLVVGNLIAGGAGKTPTVIALVQALQGAGHRPGVVSRGHGRRAGIVAPVDDGSDPLAVGDEPLLIRRRTGAPVWVGRDRHAAALALCAAEPAVDVIVSDDGLQHRALARDAELLVFDERGVGNGLLLPAGPLREPLPVGLGARARVLYTAAQATTPLPGALALRTIVQAIPLTDWRRGDAAAGRPLAALAGRRLCAAAGMAAPEKFFGMLEAAGLTIDRLPLPDHHAYATLPWPEGGGDVLTTEKDAVKLDPARVGDRPVWVVPLDLQIPTALVGELSTLLFGSGPPRPAP